VKYWAKFKTEPIKDDQNEGEMRIRLILHKASAHVGK